MPLSGLKYLINRVTKCLVSPVSTQAAGRSLVHGARQVPPEVGLRDDVDVGVVL